MADMRWLPSRRWFQFRVSTWFLLVLIVVLSISLWREYRRNDFLEEWFEAQIRAREADEFRRGQGEAALVKEIQRLEKELRDQTTGS